MTTLRETLLERLDHSDERAGPEKLLVGVYRLEEGDAFEMRGADLHGQVHFCFRDHRRLTVIDEYDDTLHDLSRRYRRVGGHAAS